MARIEKRKTSIGFTYRVQIRNKVNGKQINIFKSFSNEEDAKLFVYYKERLFENMDNFDIPLKDRITLWEICEIKMDSLTNTNKRAKEEFKVAYDRVSLYLKGKKYLKQYTFDEWLDAAKQLINVTVYRGGKNEKNARPMSLSTLRRTFACLSSAISHAISKGIPIENHPMKVMQTFINPKLKDENQS